MAIYPPRSRNWWKDPIHGVELGWIVISFLWGLFMFFFMIAWHFIGQQNLSSETYRIRPARYQAKVDAFAKLHQVKGPDGKVLKENGVPIVRPPPGSEAFIVARLWEFWPILELKKGQSYRLHLSSADWQHGFSLQPTNINISVHPGYGHVINLTPTQTGKFAIVCNEYCGINHHTMTGRIRVVD